MLEDCAVLPLQRSWSFFHGGEHLEFFGGPVVDSSPQKHRQVHWGVVDSDEAECDKNVPELECFVGQLKQGSSEK